MTRRLVLWLMVAFVVLLGLAVLIPASPVYLTKLYNLHGRYDGHSHRYWIENLDNPDGKVRRQASEIILMI